MLSFNFRFKSGEWCPTLHYKKIVKIFSIFIIFCSMFFLNLIYDSHGQPPSTKLCSSCHREQYEAEKNTKHANAYSDPVFQAAWKSRGSPDYCLNCHVTNLDYKEEGVSCLSCHTWIEGHPSAGPLEKSFSTSVCGKCHQGSHHPFYEEWNQSKHSLSLETLKKIGQNKNPTCLHCMSSEGFVYGLEGKKLKVEEVKNPISCQTCHKPHELELRVGKASELCGKCHSGSHHPQFEAWSEGSHAVVDVECDKCHMYTKPYKSEEEPAVTGHTFEVKNEACSKCHGVLEGIPKLEVALREKTEIQGEVSSKLKKVSSLLKSAESALKEANNSISEAIKAGVPEEELNKAKLLLNDSLKAYEDAEFLLTETIPGEGSKGFHNKAWTVENIAEGKAEILKVQALSQEAKLLVEQLKEKHSLSLNLKAAQRDIEAAKNQATTNLMYGGVAGLLIGIVAGFAISLIRRKE